MTAGIQGPMIRSCGNADEYEKLNMIEEGSYGIVYRAKRRETGEIVALKRLKLEEEKDGFPVTSIREIHTLKLLKHPNIVKVIDIVTDLNLKKFKLLIKNIHSYGISRT